MSHVADLDKQAEKHEWMHTKFQGLLFIQTLGTVQYYLTQILFLACKIESQCVSYNLIHVVARVGTKALVEHCVEVGQLWLF